MRIYNQTQSAHRLSHRVLGQAYGNGPRKCELASRCMVHGDMATEQQHPTLPPEVQSYTAVSSERITTLTLLGVGDVRVNQDA